ncbi:hypothetical protein D3C80_1332920 [compost metagenome]
MVEPDNKMDETSHPSRHNKATELLQEAKLKYNLNDRIIDPDLHGGTYNELDENVPTTKGGDIPAIDKEFVGDSRTQRSTSTPDNMAA